MHTTRYIALPVFFALALCLALGCNQTVRPVSIKDPVLSEDSRRLLADTEDAVSIRRAARDDARRALRQTERRSENLLDRDWPSNAAAPLQSLRALEEARIELAELEADHAQARLDLAVAKQQLTTAQTAMRHDLAVYELEPIEETQIAAKARADELFRDIAEKKRAIDALETQWWQAYAAYVKGGGSSRTFFLSEGATAQEN